MLRLSVVGSVMQQTEVFQQPVNTLHRTAWMQLFLMKKQTHLSVRFDIHTSYLALFLMSFDPMTQVSFYIHLFFLPTCFTSILASFFVG